jgi:hypothetical protein
VRNIPEWSNEYPTVINDWKGMFVQSVTGELPPILSVVTSLNGNDTKGMNEEMFNDLLMSQSKSKIEYLVKKDGSNVKKECIIQYHKSIYWAGGITMNDPEPFTENIAIKNIKNASVFNLNTYAYKTGNLTDLDETALLEVAGKALSRLGYKKTDNLSKSDMVMVLSKEKDDYNGLKITLSVLDGNKFRSGIERILWSLDVTDINGDLKKQEGVIKTALNKNCANFPFDIPTYSQGIYTLGIAFESQQAVSSGKTLEILKNSDAYDKGLRSGDAIVGAYERAECLFFMTKTRRYYFKPNKRNRQKNWSVDLFLILPIIPHFKYNNAETYLSDDGVAISSKTETKLERALVGGLLLIDSDSNSKSVFKNPYNNHFKIRDGSGHNFTVNAPFEKRKLNFRYIR